VNEQAPSQQSKQLLLEQRAAQEGWTEDRIRIAQNALNPNYTSVPTSSSIESVPDPIPQPEQTAPVVAETEQTPALIPGAEQVLAQVDEATQKELTEPDPYAAKIPEANPSAVLALKESIANSDVDALREQAILAAHSINDK